MPRGGKRPGAGRKPLSRKERWLAGGTGVTAPIRLVGAQPEGSAPVNVADKPQMLTTDEQAYWALWAPLATSCGLLTEETKPGMILLCQVACRAARVWGEIERTGLVFETTTVDGAGQEHVSLKAHPLLTHYRGLVGRMEILQGRYGLAADGKIPAGSAEDEEEAHLAKLLAIK